MYRESLFQMPEIVRYEIILDQAHAVCSNCHSFKVKVVERDNQWGLSIEDEASRAFLYLQGKTLAVVREQLP